MEQTPQVSAEQLHGLLDSAESDPLIVIDVRQPAEWEAGHVRTATLTPLAGLTRRSAGWTVLQRAGFTRVLNVTGGFDAWARVRAPCSIADQASQAFDQILRRRQQADHKIRFTLKIVEVSGLHQDIAIAQQP